VPDLGDLARKSGLESLASLPRLPRLGLPDFSKLSVDQLKQLRIPSLDDAGRMQIPAFYLPAVQLPAISVDSGGGIFGFPLEAVSR